MTKTTGFIDSHFHITGPKYQCHVESILSRYYRSNINNFIAGGIDPLDWEEQTRLRNKGIIPCFGLHPYWIADHSEEDCFSALKILESKLPLSIGIGETGLDFRDLYLARGKTHQLTFFHCQLELATLYGKVPVLHVVRAHKEAVAEMKQFPLTQGFQVHGFSSGWDQARKYLDLGGYLSIGKAILEQRFSALRDAIVKAPWDRILVESDEPEIIATDCDLVLVAKALGQLKGAEPNWVLEKSRANILTLFNKEIQ